VSPASLAVQTGTPAPAAAPGKPGSGTGKAAAGNASANAFGALMGADAGKGAEVRGKAAAKADTMARQASAWADRSAGKLKADDPQDAEAAHDPKAADAAEAGDPLALLMSVVMPPQQAAAATVDGIEKEPDGAVDGEAVVEAAVVSPKSRGTLASLLAERQARDGGTPAAEGVGKPTATTSDASAPEAEAPATVPSAQEPSPQPDASVHGKRDPQAASGPGAAQAEHKVTVVSTQVSPAPAAPVAAPSPTGAALVVSLDADGTLRSYASETASALPAGDARPVTTLKLQLHPAELGNVTVKISGAGEEIAIEIQVENTEARHRLSSDSDAIVKSLRGLGYDVDRITVQQVAPSANAGQQQSAAGGGRGDGFTAFEQRGGERGQGQQNHANANGRDNGEQFAAPQGQADRGGAAGAVYI
jgi:chemotaxis protein MotD